MRSCRLFNKLYSFDNKFITIVFGFTKVPVAYEVMMQLL